MTAALLLAAGLGSRLDPLTRLVAKPAVPLGSHTIAEHVTGWLARQGIGDIVVNLHHRPSTLTGVLGDGAHLGLSIRYSWEATVLGSAGGPRHALPLMRTDPFLIVNGDTLCDFDLAPMRKAHLASGADVTMALVPNPAPDRYNGLLMNEDLVVTGVIARGHTLPSWHFVVVQLASHQTFANLGDGVPAETVAGIYRDMIAQSPGRIRGWPVTTSFLDIGTPRDYLAAALQQPDAVARTVAIPSTTSVTRCAVWPGVTIGEHVRLEDCIVAGAVHVPDGLEATAAILVPAALVRPTDRARVQDDVAIYGIATRG